MARAPTMVIQEDYIDMDLTPTTTPPLPPSSPHRGLREFEFQSTATAVAGGSSKHREAAFASPADELFYKGNLLPLHLPPRLQLVQKLLQEQQVHVQEIKKAPSAGAACADAEAEEDMTKVCAKKYSWSKRLKLMKRWTSREYIKSLFLAKPSDNGIGNGGGKGISLDQEELCSHRKSFSGIIRRVRLVATKAAAAPPGASQLCSSSSSSSSSSTPSCGNANGSFLRPTKPAMKRSSSAGSEEGAIQGAIAHCKRSQQQQQQQQGIISARRSVSDVVFYSVSNTPRVSSVAAANDAAQERREMCRG